MNKNLTYRQKNSLLALASMIFLVVVYFAAISKTIELYKSNSFLEKEILRAEQAPERIQLSEDRARELNSTFSSYLAKDQNSQDKILETVSGFCQKNNLTLKELPVSSVSEEKDFTVETNIIVAEGNFANLVKLLYHLEYENRISRVSSAGFKSYFDNKRKKLVLSLTVYLQNIQLMEKVKS